jgi:hypothetical protein
MRLESAHPADLATIGLTGSDAVHDLLLAVRPFAAAALEGALGCGGAISFRTKSGDDVFINQVDFVRAYLVWGIHDPLSQVHTALTDPVLHRLQAEARARHGQRVEHLGALHDKAIKTFSDAEACYAAAIAARTEAMELHKKRFLDFALGALWGLITGAWFVWGQF